MARTIVFIGPGALPIPSEKGAIEEIIWKVSLELSKRGFNTYILNPISKNLLVKFARSLKLHEILRRVDERPILHFHNIILCLAYSLTTVKPHVRNTILTLHYPPWVTKDANRFILMLSILRYLTSKGVVLTAPSAAVVHWIRKTFNADVYLVPNGVDTTIFNPSKRNRGIREKLLGDKEILITYVARIHPLKNQLDLVKTVRILVHNYGIRNFRIIFIGPISGAFGENTRKRTNPYYILIRNYIEKNNLKDYVTFLGELPNKEEVANILASSDIYVHTSLTEIAVPLAVMEAMASGLPIIAYKLVYYDFLIHGLNALTVEKGNINDLTQKLLILIEDDDLRRRLGENARKFVEEHLSWNKIVKNYYIKLYECLEV